MIDLDALEAKAKAAMDLRPGEWKYDPNAEDISACGLTVADLWDDDCGHFIAAAAPATVLELARELRDARVALSKALDWDDHRRVMPMEIYLEMREVLHVTGVKS